jgi:hypothetical protein
MYILPVKYGMIKCNRYYMSKTTSNTPSKESIKTVTWDTKPEKISAARQKGSRRLRASNMERKLKLKYGMIDKWLGYRKE